MDSEWDSYLSDEPQEWSPEEIWHDFRLIHESGRGWCRVYSAVYRGRWVAVKTLKEEYRNSEVHRKLLRKEYEVMSMMNHPNIVSVLWYDSLPDLDDCIVMEYVDGLTLEDYLSGNHELNSVQIKEIITQICTATDYLHSRQTIHGDLKPANIMLTSVGLFVKLIDLGMSHGNGFKSLDFRGGTDGFAAPEGKEPGAIASRALDIYSIGKILALMDQHGQFKSVWRRCTLPSPEQRPKSVMEIPKLIEQTIKRRKTLRWISWMAVGLGAAVALGVWSFDGNNGNNGTYETHGANEIELVEDTIIDTPEVAAQPVVEREPRAERGPRAEREPRAAEPIIEPEDSEAFRQRFEEKLDYVIQVRFNDHLNLIDTMTTARSNQLQKIGNWRWLAKGEMYEWLNKELKGNRDKINRYMNEVDTKIAVFYSLDEQKTTEKQHRQDAAKRAPDLLK